MAWHLGVDAEAENLPDMQIPVYGTHIWEKLGPAEVRTLRREQLRWLLSNFMHGEQGALLATAQIVDATPWMEAKFYGSTQVMDEARHVEVFSRYLNEKLGGPYRINKDLKALIDQILTDSRWDMKYLGMQILVEGLAMAAFGFMHKMCSEPLLTDLLHYVIRDEARHVAFGVIALKDYFAEMPPKEMREREEFVYEGCRLMRDRLLAEEVWEVDGLAGGRGEGHRPALAVDDRVPQDAVLEGRSQREAARAAHSVGARALRRARHPAVRGLRGLGLSRHGDRRETSRVRTAARFSPAVVAPAAASTGVHRGPGQVTAPVTTPRQA